MSLPNRPGRLWCLPVSFALVLVLCLPLRGSESGTIHPTPRAHDSILSAGAGNLVRPALAAESRGDAAAALRLFLQADAIHPNDAFILQKISKQYSDLSDDAPDPAAKQRLCTNALAFAKRAVAFRPRDAVNVLSLAICYGKLALLADTRTKVAYSRLIHDYAERSLALDPDYALAHHVLGRWNCEVAAVGATKQFLARLLYGGLPPASFAEAIRQFRRAIALDPRSPSHRAALGFAFLADGQPAAARTAFTAALALPPRDKYDAESLRRAAAALARIAEK